ncbi:PucR family transcriptional regulator ligand-binding domain-containing protein [Ihubacter sp. rT4E-8]|uniref:PucR family transcriptional regulator ligand-binding domain-containing protein n=1 Tax=Ihubacter sp. rT4E-8 TaxID=3242369 RepID=UPI003CF8E834
MNYTVSDFYLTFAAGLKIIAGRGGMTRSISRAGILDYEMDLVLKDKYMHSNFQENQLVISTFLYAKDNPFLIADAVKHLIAKGTSGLVIKNVFGLPIHDTVLRYADSKNFPIFLVESQDVYIEDLIYAVNRHRELLADIRFAQKKLEQILFGDLTEKEIPACAKQINPSYRQQFFTLYIKMDDLLSNAAFDTFSKRFQKAPSTSRETAWYSFGRAFSTFTPKIESASGVPMISSRRF